MDENIKTENKNSGLGRRKRVYLSETKKSNGKTKRSQTKKIVRKETKKKERLKNYD